MIDEEQEEKNPGEAKLVASFFQEEIASIDVPPPPSVELSYRRIYRGTSSKAASRASRKTAPAFLPDLLFASAVFLLLTITLGNPKYSLQSPLSEAGIGFAREKQIGYHLEKGLIAFHEAAAPVFRNPVFRSKGEKK